MNRGVAASYLGWKKPEGLVCFGQVPMEAWDLVRLRGKAKVWEEAAAPITTVELIHTPPLKLGAFAEGFYAA